MKNAPINPRVKFSRPYNKRSSNLFNAFARHRCSMAYNTVFVVASQSSRKQRDKIVLPRGVSSYFPPPSDPSESEKHPGK